jgi:hypothetical protein
MSKPVAANSKVLHLTGQTSTPEADPNCLPMQMHQQAADSNWRMLPATKRKISGSKLEYKPSSFETDII